MKKVVALRNYSDRYIVIREGMIYNLDDSIADSLIEKGVLGLGVPDDISVTPSSTTGTQIADIKVNGQSNKIYAPAGSGSGGMTLYGPYCARNEGGEKLQAGLSADIELSIIKDAEYNAVTYPHSSTPVMILLESYDAGTHNMIIKGVHPPYVGIEDHYPASFYVENVGNTQITLTEEQVGISFYSSVEFPVAEGD